MFNRLTQSIGRSSEIDVVTNGELEPSSELPWCMRSLTNLSELTREQARPLDNASEKLNDIIESLKTLISSESENWFVQASHASVKVLWFKHLLYA